MEESKNSELAVVVAGPMVEMSEVTPDDDQSAGDRRLYPFRVRMNMPDINTDLDGLGEFRSPRIHIELDGTSESGDVDASVIFEVGCDELTEYDGKDKDGRKLWKPVHTAQTFLEHIEKTTPRGNESGLHRNVKDRIDGLYWDNDQRKSFPIPGHDMWPAYRYVVATYSGVKGKKIETKAVVPPWMVVNALENRQLVSTWKVLVQGLNYRVENAGTSDQVQSAGRLIVVIEPIWEKGEIEKGRWVRHPKFGVYKQGLVLLLDDPRYAELEWQLPSMKLRALPFLRANSGYPFALRRGAMSPEQHEAAAKKFAGEYWGLTTLMHTTGTPLGGQPLAAFLGSDGGLVTAKDFQAEAEACLAILKSSVTTAEDKAVAKEVWRNLQLHCQEAAAFVQWVAEEKRKLLDAKAEAKKPVANGKVEGDKPAAKPVETTSAEAATTPTASSTEAAGAGPVSHAEAAPPPPAETAAPAESQPAAGTLPPAEKPEDVPPHGASS